MTRTSDIFYLGRNNLDYSLTFAIRGVRWEYFFLSPRPCDKIENIVRRASAAKGLAMAKRLAIRGTKVDIYPVERISVADSITSLHEQLAESEK